MSDESREAGYSKQVSAPSNALEAVATSEAIKPTSETTRDYSLHELANDSRFKRIFPKTMISGRISQAYVPRTADRRVKEEDAEKFVKFMDGKIYALDAIRMLEQAGIPNVLERARKIKDRLNIGVGLKGLCVYDIKAVEEYIASQAIIPTQENEFSLSRLLRDSEYSGVFLAMDKARLISTTYLPRTQNGKIRKEDAEKFAQFMKDKIYIGNALALFRMRGVLESRKKVAELKSRTNIGSEKNPLYVFDKKDVEEAIKTELIKQELFEAGPKESSAWSKKRKAIEREMEQLEPFDLVDYKKVTFTHTGLAELLNLEPDEVEETIKRRGSRLKHKNGKLLIPYKEAEYVRANSEYLAPYPDGFAPRLVSFRDVVRKLKKRKEDGVGFGWGPLSTYGFARKCGIALVGFADDEEVLTEEDAGFLLKILPRYYEWHRKEMWKKAHPKIKLKKDDVPAPEPAIEEAES